MSYEAETIKEKNKDNTESGSISVSVLAKVLSLYQLSYPQIWNIENEKDKENENVGDHRRRGDQGMSSGGQWEGLSGNRVEHMCSRNRSRKRLPESTQCTFFRYGI